MSDAWIARARAALDGSGASEGSDVERIAIRRPVLVDRAVAVALVTLVVGVLLFVGAILRELQTGNPFDRLAMPMRFVGIVALLRGLVGAWALVGRLRLSGARDRYGLVLTDDGLVLRTPTGEHAIARARVLGAVEPGDWGARTGFRRFSFVYLLVVPDREGRAIVPLPPIFEESPGVLAERLVRWRGVSSARANEGTPEVAAPAERLASKIYDDAARGQPGAGVAVIRHGAGWLRRGPYAALLFALVFAEATLRLPSEISLGILPVAALVVCLAIPATWIALTWRHVAPRRGLALVLTADEALLRTRAGVLRARWSEVPATSVESLTGWSLLEGRSVTRKLRFDRLDAPPIRYDEAFLGVPAEVALALVDAYRKGAIGRAESA
ncbi:MAG: hypothetical protein MUE69_22550 [Myxococcota bacterium]|jgi:hypothetical protein|nr:hypothetical protein [Myxococcota bacterium]